jgi:tyrosine decarboxylase / aspartate 1-decarboxylase
MKPLVGPMTWPALPAAEVSRRVHDALDTNRSYATGDLLGLPGSYLDQEVFPANPEVLSRPWLRTAVENPNHIGCHTLGESEPAFAGTQALEQEVVALCAEHVLGAEPDTVDGYVASGGTESNIQAIWAFRNAWRAEGVDPGQIAILCSTDTHYSAHKAADLLGVHIQLVPVDDWSRAMSEAAINAALDALQQRGVTHVALMLTMGTTMFGSVDALDPPVTALESRGLSYRVHIDAAFGGFIFPFTRPGQPLGFQDPRISSVTLDAHKMLQAPYGTGIHLIRKGMLTHTTTRTAAYVPGLDCTLVGSRSGANALAVWMILQTWGYEGGKAFVETLAARAARLVADLADMGIRTVYTPGMNVVTLRDADVPPELSERFLLVSDSSSPAQWRKIVVMEHVTDAALDRFLDAMREHRA